MSVLLEPLDEPQRQLVDIVWPIFAEHARFPIYNYVEHQMRQRGLDAREVISSFPSVGLPSSRAHYSAIWVDSSGQVIQSSSEVRLTVAGLYHIKDQLAVDTINALLAYLDGLTAACRRAAEDPFVMRDSSATLAATLKAAGWGMAIGRHASVIAVNEWPAMRVSPFGGEGDVSGGLGLLGAVNLDDAEECLVAVTAAMMPQQPATILQYRDPRALSRSITNFDITCELVLQKKMVKKPALDRTALFVQDAASYTDLQAGISALGELLGDLDVPGPKSTHPTGRLLAHLVHELSSIDQSRVQDALNLMDAVREIRNSGVHPKPSAKLIAAHERLGLLFPLRDPAHTWDVIRAQMDVAFSILQEEIYAARP